MKRGLFRPYWPSVPLVFFLGVLLFLPHQTAAQDIPSSAPDKALFEKMMQFGKAAFQAGRYLDAKTYFRKALRADPSSAAAWEHYDLSVIHALAEKINKNTGLIPPDAAAGDSAQGAAPPPPPTQETKPAKKPTFIIVEDEGC